jgi:hypothetical protein
MTVKLPDVSEFQSPASGNAPNWQGSGVFRECPFPS